MTPVITINLCDISGSAIPVSRNKTLGVFPARYFIAADRDKAPAPRRECPSS